MDPLISRQIKKCMPKMNDRVCNGIATEHMKNADIFIDERWSNTIAPLASMGLTYHGGVRCPISECIEHAASRSSKGKRYLELEKTDMYLMKYKLKLHGEELPPVYLYIPFISSPGGMLSIKGSNFALAPVPIDRAISVGEDQIFVNVGKDRFSFRRHLHYFFQNDVRVSEYVVWANIHHTKRAAKNRGNGPYSHVHMDATPVLYLLSKYGFTGMMQRYGTKNFEIGLDISENTHPSSKWTIFSSTQSCPNTYKGGLRSRALYQPTQIKIAIKNKDMSPRLISMMAGLFYIMDHFPDRCNIEYMDDINHWRLILGHNTFNSQVIESRLLQDIDTHMNSIDGYIDNIVRRDLHSGGINTNDVNDIYDLFVYMIDHLPSLISQGAGNINTLYGKQLVVLPYVLTSLVKMIVNFSFSLRPGAQRKLTYKDVEKSMRGLKPKVAREMNSGNPVVTSVSSSSDNMLFKITTVMIQQNNCAGGGKKRQGNHNDTNTLLNASLAEVASWNHLPKSSPSGYERINPYVIIGDDSTILRNKKLVTLMDTTQDLIQR